MSKEAEEFYRKKRVESAKRPRMKKFLSIVNYEEEGKIMQEYADMQLKLHGIDNSFYCYDETVQIAEDTGDRIIKCKIQCKKCK